ncbi:putative acyl-CoA dehydrogenase [Camelimonas fluminis]|uniref:Acyl-CoA dehydrogenase family protein n=1 Tax=Camelimonas fluminis TaxID=1576911 RepID=A0ABV7UGS8_9HYPH|nr:acyl-CoA dehydrogenase family protein [Camelimonas fluminis]GHE78447.1 putative acyl-CoA dehydrogenase [Camelimonas fluminis]
MIDFELSPELTTLRDRVETFIASKVVPMENDPRQTPHGPAEELRLELVNLARAEGLLSPHAPVAYGGLGLNHREMAVIFEAAGWSTLGPLALNIQAGDEGNVNLLNQIATPSQKERWLAPLARGEVRSVFSMTETVTDGAGADASRLNTIARQESDDFIINGQKYMITGVPGAAFNIVMARTLDSRGEDLGASMFVLDIDCPGFSVTRMLDTIDANSPGGHAVVRFDDVRVSADRLLGNLGQGFRNAQVRLGPARLTHCMRWLGAAKRCHAVAAAHASVRHSFGKTIGEHQGVSFMLADNEIDMHLARLSIWHTAWLLDKGEQARDETSIAKVYCSEALGRVVDRSLQILGAIGITRDTVVERIYRDIRPFRIYDGPSEVHRHVLGRRILGRHTQV